MNETCCSKCPVPQVQWWKKGYDHWETYDGASGNQAQRTVLPSDPFDVCIVRALAHEIRQCPACRQRFAETFGIPDLWWKKYCRGANGYFGCETTVGDNGAIAALNTWARFQVKLTNEDHPGYEWLKLNTFTRWTPTQTILIIFDLREPLASCMKRVPKEETERDPLFELPDESHWIDPYWAYIRILEKVATLQDAAVWAVRDTVRTTEKMRYGNGSTSPDMPKPAPDYRHLHETARHAIHVSETLDTGVKAARKILLEHDSHKAGPGPAGAQPDAAWTRAWHHTHQRLSFYEDMLSSLQERSASNKARQYNEISLAYNMVAQADSSMSVQIGHLTQKDSEAMKTIAFLTLLFLPATFVSAVFSTSFFDFDADSGLWQVSDQFWLYWAVAIPITTATAALWYCRHGLPPSGLLKSLQRDQAPSNAKHLEEGRVEAFAAFRRQVQKREV
ncbi:hypothetical protein CH35J_002208 [Colletotrichum higginsianum]|uniref:Uncharacterized protein n=1 Tax=Colletotrichum higginsianum TaxID=80884 RepID=A0A4T0WFW7_9PEZI|nr:hypothetical protein CH35J_002208 [Colletotrichum higginsianum]